MKSKQQHRTTIKFTIVPAVMLLLCLMQVAKSTFDINPRQLQMVADHLTMDECRKLSESLHESEFLRSHDPTGISEPKGVSCLRLLEHWNTHEGKGQTFHQLSLRLRQLGKKDIADRLAKSVSEEKVAEVQEAFLSDPFKSRIHTNSPILEESPPAESPPPPTREYRGWTVFEIIVTSLLVVFAVVMCFLGGMCLLKTFLPDSYERMRATFYVSCSGKRPTDEELYFML